MPIEHCYVLTKYDGQWHVTKDKTEADVLITYGWTLMATAMETKEGNGN